MSASGLNFSFDHGRYLLCAKVRLPLWREFVSINQLPDLTDGHALIVIDGPGPDDADAAASAIQNNEAAIDWVLSNMPQIQSLTLGAIAEYVDRLMPILLDGGLSASEIGLESFVSTRRLEHCISLSYLRFPAHQVEDIPVFGLEFECDWDPNHGCGAGFEGFKQVAIGSAESATHFLLG